MARGSAATDLSMYLVVELDLFGRSRRNVTLLENSIILLLLRNSVEVKHSLILKFGAADEAVANNIIKRNWGF